MQEIIKIPDNVFEKETAGTIFGTYENYLIMLILCNFDNRTYTLEALHRELNKIVPGVKKENISSSLIELVKEDYIGAKGKIIKNYFPKDKGKKAYVDMNNKLLEVVEYSPPKKTIKPRKSFIQEFNDHTGIDTHLYDLLE